MEIQNAKTSTTILKRGEYLEKENFWWAYPILCQSLFFQIEGIPYKPSLKPTYQSVFLVFTFITYGDVLDKQSVRFNPVSHCGRMPANESSLRVTSWGDLIAKFFIKNVLFTNIRNNYSLKIKKTSFHNLQTVTKNKFSNTMAKNLS